MQLLTKEEETNIYGGAKALSATMVGNIIKGASFLFDLGRSLGTAIRRIQTKKWC